MPTPLVLVPGLLCDGRLWSHQVEYLSDIADPVVADVPTSDSVGGMARDVLRRTRTATSSGSTSKRTSLPPSPRT